MIRSEEAKERKRLRTRERYNWLKSLGYCTQCGHTEASVGSNLCPDCAEKRDISHKKYREKNYDRERIRLESAEMYHKRVNNRICVRCGKSLDEGYEHKRCEYCLMKHRQYQRERYRHAMSIDQIDALNLCRICRKERREPLRTICTGCKERLQQNAKNHWGGRNGFGDNDGS